MKVSAECMVCAEEKEFTSREEHNEDIYTHEVADYVCSECRKQTFRGEDR